MIVDIKLELKRFLARVGEVRNYQIELLLCEK